MSATTDDLTAEVAAWRDLTESPGWDRLVAHAKAEWEGPAFVAQVEQLADNTQDPVALSKLRQLLAAKRAVMRLLTVPEEAIGKAKRKTGAAELLENRRGRL